MGNEQPGFFSRTAAMLRGHPTAFWFFFWGELAERCSYYGMNAILLLYMTEKLQFEKPDASRWVSYFVAGSYFTPLLGGFVADRYLGKYRTIVYFSIPYVLGNALMLIPSTEALVAALVILALGSGVIKPNISTLMGLTYDQQRPGDDRLRSDAFAMFYWAVNVGSVISQAGMPRLRDKVGPNLAFLLPTTLMSVALVIFALGRRFYAVETTVHARKTPEERRAQWEVLTRLLGVFILVTVFWSVMKHYQTVWVLFTGERLNTTVFGTHYRPDQFQFLNSLFVLTLLPIAALVFRMLETRGIHLRPTDKMQVGFLFTALTPFIFIAADAAAGDGLAHIGWLVLAFFCVTTAEVLISPVGLELAFVAAPKSMKGFITACFLLATSGAGLINAWATPWYSRVDAEGQRLLTPAQYFGGQAAVAVTAAICFFFVARPFNRALAKNIGQEAGPIAKESSMALNDQQVQNVDPPAKE
jgi:POT family proton-dependent oligopeptide transporter